MTVKKANKIKAIVGLGSAFLIFILRGEYLFMRLIIDIVPSDFLFSLLVGLFRCIPIGLVILTDVKLSKKVRNEIEIEVLRGKLDSLKKQES